MRGFAQLKIRGGMFFFLPKISLDYVLNENETIEYQECHEYFDEGLTFTFQYGVNMVDIHGYTWLTMSSLSLM